LDGLICVTYNIFRVGTDGNRQCEKALWNGHNPHVAKGCKPISARHRQMSHLDAFLLTAGIAWVAVWVTLVLLMFV
jgi:hypothetical protein